MNATGGARRLEQEDEVADDAGAAGVAAVAAAAGELGEDEVAGYIAAHPDLLLRRPELLAAVDLPDPHDGRAVSLGQRQTAILRDRLRSLDLNLADLMRRGRENDTIDERVTRWAALLLAERDETALPGRLVQELQGVFDVPAAALRLWDLDPRFHHLPSAAAVSADILRFADSMHAPFCGPNSGFAAAAWLDNGSEPVRSLALVALRESGATPGGPAAGGDSRAFGLLVLGSPDPQRFRSEMGTDYLARIGAMAAAAVSRLRAR